MTTAALPLDWRSPDTKPSVYMVTVDSYAWTAREPALSCSSAKMALSMSTPSQSTHPDMSRVDHSQGAITIGESWSFSFSLRPNRSDKAVVAVVVVVRHWRHSLPKADRQTPPQGYEVGGPGTERVGCCSARHTCYPPSRSRWGPKQRGGCYSARHICYPPAAKDPSCPRPRQMSPVDAVVSAGSSPPPLRWCLPCTPKRCPAKEGVVAAAAAVYRCHPFAFAPH